MSLLALALPAALALAQDPGPAQPRTIPINVQVPAPAARPNASPSPFQGNAPQRGGPGRAVEFSFGPGNGFARENVFCFDMKPTPNAFEPYRCTHAELSPVARLYSSESPEIRRRIYVVAAGVHGFGDRRVELHIYDTGEAFGRFLAFAWLITPRGAPCARWKDVGLDSLELKAGGCRFDAQEVAQGTLVSDPLPEKEGERMSGSLTFAEFPAPVKFANFAYSVPLRRGRLPR